METFGERVGESEGAHYKEIAQTGRTPVLMVVTTRVTLPPDLPSLSAEYGIVRA